MVNVPTKVELSYYAFGGIFEVKEEIETDELTLEELCVKFRNYLAKEEKLAIVKRNLSGESALSLSKEIGSSDRLVRDWVKIYLAGYLDLFNNERPVRKLKGKPPVLFRTELVA